MPTHSSSSADVLKKMLHSARRLRYRGKHARARMKLQLALRWVDSRGVTADDEADGTPEDDARGYLPYTPQELRVALADCICREADEVRLGGLSRKVHCLSDEEENNDDDDSDDDDVDRNATLARKRRRSAPGNTVESDGNVVSDENDLVTYARLLQEALKQVEAGLDAEGNFRASRSISAVNDSTTVVNHRDVNAASSSPSSSLSSSSSSVCLRRFLILGAEILVKLSRLGPIFRSPFSPSSSESASSSRSRALQMIDNLEQLDQTLGKADAVSSEFGNPCRIDRLLERRLWRTMYGLRHPRYRQLVQDHPAVHLIRDERKMAVFVSSAGKRRLAEADDDDDENNDLLLDDRKRTMTTTTSKARAWENDWHPCALSSLDQALTFILPDGFHDALNGNDDDDDVERSYRDSEIRITTILLMSSSVRRANSKEGETCREDMGKEKETEKETEKEPLVADGEKWFRTTKRDIETLEKQYEEMCSEFDQDSDRYDWRHRSGGHEDEEAEEHHVCFYQQRFFRWENYQRDGEFVVQLLFCDLCALEEDVNAIFFLHGLTPKAMVDPETEEEERLTSFSESFTLENENRRFTDDDFGLAKLTLEDKEIFGQLFPSIESVF